MNMEWSTLDESIKGALAGAGLDALLVVRDTNQRYLEGYTGSECYLLIAPGGRWLFADSRYSEQAERECRSAKVVLHRDPHPPYADMIASVIREQGLRRIGFEKEVLTYGQYETIASALASVPGSVLVPSDGLVEPFRMVKRADELELIRRACAIADQGLGETLGQIRAGMSELELARELEGRMALAGAEGVAFQTIVAFGARASQPHAVPDAKVRLNPGDFILIDYGAAYAGYRSDTTRTLVFGKADARQKKAYATVLEAQLRGIAAVAPGVPGTRPDAASRSHMIEHGYPEFTYGVGHGVGLDIHELPFMNRRCKTTLAEGMIVTVEPGVYIPGWGGIRIEDTVLVTASGSECLTRCPKDTLLEI